MNDLQAQGFLISRLRARGFQRESESFELILACMDVIREIEKERRVLTPDTAGGKQEIDNAV